MNATLPPEIIFQIMKKCESIDLLPWCLVSREWSTLAYKEIQDRPPSIGFEDDKNIENYLASIAGSSFRKKEYPFTRFQFNLTRTSKRAIEHFLYVVRVRNEIQITGLDLLTENPRQSTDRGREAEDYCNYVHNIIINTRVMQKMKLLLQNSNHLKNLSIKSFKLMKSELYSRCLPSTFPVLRSLTITFSYQKFQREKDFLYLQIIGRSPALFEFHQDHTHTYLDLESNSFEFEEMKLTNLVHILPPTVKYFSISNLFLTPENTEVIDRMTSMKCRFQKIMLVLISPQCSKHVNQDVTTNFDTLLQWLKNSHQNYFTMLSFIFRQRGFLHYKISTLANLHNFDIGFKNAICFDNCEEISNFPRIGSTFNALPFLHTLSFSNYVQIPGLFDECCIPSVKTLEFVDTGDEFLSEPWKVIFPNFTSLKVKNMVTKEQIKHIFTQLTHLETLELCFLGTIEIDYWDVVTGGAERIDDQDMWSLDEYDFIRLRSRFVKPHTSSIRNMNHLTSLKFEFCTKSLIMALVYMTQTKQLNPIKNIYIVQRPDNYRYKIGFQFSQLEDYVIEEA